MSTLQGLKRPVRTMSLAVLCSAGVGLGTVVASDRPKTEDHATKLKRIGRALQLYRQEYGVLPVSKRATYSDAGLPPTLVVLATVKEKPWSLDLEDFQVDHPLVPEITVHFRELYYPDDVATGHRLPKLSTFLIRRGEKLPVLQDMNVADPSLWETKDVAFKTLVLRLDGTVEPVTVSAQSGSTFDPMDNILDK